MNAAMKNIRIEFHILYSFPVSCLNRDDVGAPKSARVGGVNRARVSSQCWKRQVRLALQDLGLKLGLRTKKLQSLIEPACRQQGANDEQARACAEHIAKQLSDDTLIFISTTEVESFASYAQEVNFDPKKIKDKELAKRATKVLNPAIDALDIALFGRMVAKSAEMHVTAATSFSHAISTHQVTNEVEFFTALDDYQEEPGSAHIGSLEFNAATYYRYISLDLGQLAQTFGSENMQAPAEQLQQAVAAFTKALFIAVPEARQTTQAAACPWAYAKVLVRKGQGLQVSFEQPVRAQAGGGYLQPSIDTLKNYLRQKESQFGSLFGHLGDYEWGLNDCYSLDHLIKDLTSHIQPEMPAWASVTNSETQVVPA